MDRKIKIQEYEKLRQLKDEIKEIDDTLSVLSKKKKQLQKELVKESG